MSRKRKKIGETEGKRPNTNVLNFKKQTLLLEVIVLPDQKQETLLDNLENVEAVNTSQDKVEKSFPQNMYVTLPFPQQYQRAQLDQQFAKFL